MRRSQIHLQTGISTVATLLAVVGIAALLLIAIYVAVEWKEPLATPPEAKTLTIEVNASPEGAEIFIDGKSAGTSTVRRALPVGKHDLLVSRSGYLPWNHSFEAAGSLKIPVALEAIPMTLRIVPGQEKVEVWLDEQPLASSPDGSGGWTLSGIAPGTHSIRIKTAAGESTTSFDFSNGNPSAPVFPETGPTVLFISSADGKVRAECNCKGELQLQDASQPLEPGTAATFEVDPGKYPAELKGLPGPRKVANLTVGPTPDATLAFFWPVPVAAKSVMNIQALLNSSVNLLKDSKCDAAQANVDQVLSRAPGNADAIGISRRIERLRSVGGCR